MHTYNSPIRLLGSCWYFAVGKSCNPMPWERHLKHEPRIHGLSPRLRAPFSKKTKLEVDLQEDLRIEANKSVSNLEGQSKDSAKVRIARKVARQKMNL